MGKRFPSTLDFRHGEQHFRLLADGIPHMIMTTDADGEIDYCNRRWIQEFMDALSAALERPRTLS